ncbi:MAG: type II CAAX endopeptidase family protein [Ignavibacteriaceae bacterium]
MSEFENNPQQDDEEEKSRIEEKLKRARETYPLISPIAAAFLGLIGGFFLYQFVGGALTLVIFGFDLESASVDGLRLMTMAGEILFILLPALLFARWIYGDVSDVISVKIPSWIEVVLFSVGIIVLMPLLQSYLYIQNFIIERLAANVGIINSIKTVFDSLNDMVEKTYGNLLAAHNIPEMILVVIAVSIVPAVCEEVMFRGYIQKSFQFKLKPFRAAFITAIFFSLYHFNPYGFFPLAALGLYLGFAAYLSESLVVPIVLHFLNNFGAVLLYFIVGNDELINSDVTNAEGMQSNIFIFVILIFLFTLVIFAIKKYYSKIRNA